MQAIYYINLGFIQSINCLFYLFCYIFFFTLFYLQCIHARIKFFKVESLPMKFYLFFILSHLNLLIILSVNIIKNFIPFFDLELNFDFMEIISQKFLLHQESNMIKIIDELKPILSSNEISFYIRDCTVDII